MPKCPHCGEDIEYLRHAQSGYGIYYLFLEPRDLYMDYRYEWEEFTADSYYQEYSCPECYKVLFMDEEKAVKWLEGKGELEEQ